MNPVGERSIVVIYLVVSHNTPCIAQMREKDPDSWKS